MWECNYNVFVEVANKVLSGCVTCKEVCSEQYMVVYEVDYLFLEEYDGQRQESDDDSDDVDLKHKDNNEASPQEHNYNDSLWVCRIMLVLLLVNAFLPHRVIQYKVKR